MDDRSVGIVDERARGVAHHRRMREDCVVTFSSHPAWYPGAASLPLPDGHGSRRDDPLPPVHDRREPFDHPGPRFDDRRPLLDDPLPLLDDLGTIRRRWRDAQARFVDDPVGALADAQGVLELLTRALDRALRGEREALARRWDGVDGSATEDLRRVMCGYGALIERLLAM